MENIDSCLSSLEWIFARAKAGSPSAQEHLKGFPVSDVEKVKNRWENDPAYREHLQRERHRGE